MRTKQEFIDLILPIIKDKLIGTPDPIHSKRTIVDVRITLEDENEYIRGPWGECDGGEYDGGNSFDLNYTDFKIEYQVKMPSGKIRPGWETLTLSNS